MKITISRRQWEEMGRIAGWEGPHAKGHGRFSKDLSQVLENHILAHKNRTPEEIAHMLKSERWLSYLMREEMMSDTELMEMVNNTLQAVSVE